MKLELTTKSNGVDTTRPHDIVSAAKLKMPSKMLLSIVMLAAAISARAQDDARNEHPRVAQVVALDECDPATFNLDPPNGVGAGFCKNVALGAVTQFFTLLNNAKQGNPDPKWDFEPDTLNVKAGTVLSVTDQGGEPHTFTEVAQFGGGFIDALNGPGEQTVSECNGGFANIAVARTRILQGSTVQISGLSKGEHRFQCCIHPWMRVTVNVK